MNTLSPQLLRWLFTALFVAVAMGILVTSHLFLQVKKKDMIENLVEVHGFHLVIAELALKKDWHHILTDLSLLSNTPELAKAFDEMSAEETASSHRGIEAIFDRFLNANKIYHKVRLIDLNGRETIKAHYDRIWDTIQEKNIYLASPPYKPHGRSPDLLQDKSKKVYFNETRKLPKGGVYVSPFDLNTEFDQIIADLPTIRFSTPIYNENDLLKGILVLSYNGIHLLNNFKSVLPIGVDAALLNAEGYWFHRIDNQHLFGFATGDAYSFGHEFPEVWTAIHHTTSGVVENQQGIFLHQEFRPFREGTPDLSDRLQNLSQGRLLNDLNNYVWKIVIRIRPDELDGKLDPIRQVTWTVAAAGTGLLFLLCFVFYLWFHRKIQEREEKKSELIAQNIFHELQVLVYQNQDLQSKLDLFLHKLFSLPWLNATCRGAIFLSGEDHRPQLAASYPLGQVFALQCGGNEANCHCRQVFYNKEEPSPHNGCMTFPAWKQDKLEAVLGIFQDRSESESHFHAVFDDRLRSFLQNAAQLLTDLVGRHRDLEEFAKLHRAVDQSPASVVITDLRGKIEYVNERFTKVSGYTASEAIGQTPGILKSGEMSPSIYQELWQTILAGQEWQGELCNRHKDGSLYWEWALITPIRNPQGQMSNFLAIKEDITDKKRATEERLFLEKQLRQAQKMEAIGHLTGGIAHDFNNILAAIKGFTELSLLRFATDEQSKLNAYLKNILTASDRARDLIAQMLVFSRSKETETRRVLVEPLVKEVVKLMRATLPASISITTNFSRDSLEVSADPVQMHQILMNLFVNARDAMAGKGRLDVEVFMEKGEKNLLCTSCHSLFSIKDKIVLMVRDDGPGIPTEIQSKIFEPFFTTKEVGQGTGMGLSMVHGIVHSFQGHIVLESSEQGTTFFLYFNRLQEKPSQPAPVSPLPRIYSEQKGHVLVVDDEVAILGFLREHLAGEGFKVTACNTSLEALVTFESNPQKFNLVITDQTMPEMTGLELVQRLLTIQPKLPIILCTGYSREVNEVTARGYGIHTFLKKPVELAKLNEALREILGDR
ncbi:MAG: PAS domain S-box protein [Magnetococcales bacterium]|nr:PAS domain S-box protein [Magnetococcales bacterium]NGZ25536.1 PAS domain S-box protein [Magnetococcales bacterium]